jgi:guanylate kinase
MSKKLILMGKAASGKDFFKDYLNSKGYKTDVSYTTRPQRVGEVPGYTYVYLTEEIYDDCVFHHSVEFNGWKYGTTAGDWEDKQVFLMAVVTLEQLTEEELRDSIIVYFDIPIEVRRERLEKRSDSDSVSRRLLADAQDFKDFKNYDVKVTYEKFDPEILLTELETEHGLKNII